MNYLNVFLYIIHIIVIKMDVPENDQSTKKLLSFLLAMIFDDDKQKTKSQKKHKKILFYR